MEKALRFAFFCFYLLLAVIAGAMMLGLKLVFITIHPMKWGATLMNSFLFNVGLILLCSIRLVHLCDSILATAFGYYAQATAAQEIFGHRCSLLEELSTSTRMEKKKPSAVPALFLM
ncbi:hypothetical protein Bca52824_041674 [Brassica carinata]|uniref:Uncharacterized protein n=1 Tax=Brassica carinata TaxID=52824 RepID=A0A8X7UWN9_BRACI|nr:hypothetical protein Bca52824_041674 [Brassica carinata]